MYVETKEFVRYSCYHRQVSKECHKLIMSPTTDISKMGSRATPDKWQITL